MCLIEQNTVLIHISAFEQNLSSMSFWKTPWIVKNIHYTNCWQIGRQKGFYNVLNLRWQNNCSISTKIFARWKEESDVEKINISNKLWIINEAKNCYRSVFFARLDTSMKYNIITGYSTCVFYEVIEDWNSRKFFNALIFGLRIQNNRHGLNFLFPVLKQIVTKTSQKLRNNKNEI